MSLGVNLLGKQKEVLCYACGCEHTELDVLYSANITHNLCEMASAAGIYYHLWRPEEKGFEFAEDIVKGLENGLRKMKAKPNYYKTFNAKNGWGLYKHFVPFVENYLIACKEYPNANIHCDR